MIREIGKLKYSSRHTSLRMWEVNVSSGTRPLREHRHINFEISLVLEGSGVYHTAVGKINVEKNDVFIFTSNEPHCIIDVEKGGLKLLNLHFSKNVVENNFSLNTTHPYIFFNHSKNFICKIANTKSENIKKMLLLIRAELLNKDEGYETIISSAISNIFIELIRNHNFYSKKDNLSSAIIKKLEKGIDYINAHYTEDLSLEEIAAQSNISPNYFSSLFSKCLNMKLWDYITAKRIEKAIRILNENKSESTILNIAIECGFNNTANFNRSFKLHTGSTPTQYCKNRYEGMI